MPGRSSPTPHAAPKRIANPALSVSVFAGGGPETGGRLCVWRHPGEGACKSLVPRVHSYVIPGLDLAQM